MTEPFSSKEATYITEFEQRGGPTAAAKAVKTIQHMKDGDYLEAAARTLPELWDAIRDAIGSVTPSDSRAFFTAAGYKPE